MGKSMLHKVSSSAELLLGTLVPLTEQIWTLGLEGVSSVIPQGRQGDCHGSLISWEHTLVYHVLWWLSCEFRVLPGVHLDQNFVKCIHA